MASDPASNGPVLASKPELFALAVQLIVLAQRLKEFAGSGPTACHAYALTTLEQVRALVGGSAAGAAEDA